MIPLRPQHNLNSTYTVSVKLSPKLVEFNGIFTEILAYFQVPGLFGYLGEVQDTDFELSLVELLKRVRHLNNTLNHFWKRWTQKYLREAHRYSSESPEVMNDLVMVHDESQPRGFWRFAKVENLIIGRDNRVRGATLRVSSTLQ